MRIALGFQAAVGFSIIALTLNAQYTLGATPQCMPSNADTAFRQVPLSTPSGGVGYVFAGHPEWPAFLDSSSLVRAIGGVDSILIASTRLLGVSINLDGSVTYTLPPNTYANRVGTIITANNGQPWDGGLRRFVVTR